MEIEKAPFVEIDPLDPIAETRRLVAIAQRGIDEKHYTQGKGYQDIASKVAQEIFEFLEDWEVTTNADIYTKFIMWSEQYQELKTKYGVK